MGYILNTDDVRFNGMTLETRRESFRLGVPRSRLGDFHDGGDGQHAIVEFSYEDIAALRELLALAEARNAGR